jgi:hypothetical protein
MGHRSHYYITIASMGKFFLPEHSPQLPRKPTDYRLSAYRQLLQLAKGKHLKYVSTAVKDINVKRDSGELYLRQEQQL